MSNGKQLLSVAIVAEQVRDEMKVGFDGDAGVWIPTENVPWVDEPSKRSIAKQARRRFDIDDCDDGTVLGEVYVRKGGPAGVVDIEWR